MAPLDHISVVVLGGAGIARDLMHHVLSESGFQLITAEQVPATGGAVVAVLVEPGVGDWAAASPPTSGVILVTERPLEDHSVVEIVLRGIDAILHTDATTREIVQTVCSVASGGTVLHPRSVRALAELLRECHRNGRRVGTRLTRRERDILASIDKGDSVKQTARALGITTKTVENLQTRLFRKLGVRNRAQAVGRAHSLGLLGGVDSHEEVTVEQGERVGPRRPA